jgi:dihydroxyacetone kinase-like predicted kinase
VAVARGTERAAGAGRAAGVERAGGAARSAAAAQVPDSARVSDSARLADGNGGPGVGARAVAYCGAVAVVSGDGMHELFASFGVHAVDGGEQLDPSPSQLLAAIHGVPCEEVVVLPNSPAALATARHAAQLSEKRVVVVGASSQQAGLAAAVELMPDRSAADNGAALDIALARLRSGAVIPARHDDPDGRYHAGDAVGVVEDHVVAWGEARETLRAVLRELSGGAELISCIAGRDAPLDEAAVTGLGPDGVELEQRRGGQPAEWWLLVAE